MASTEQEKLLRKARKKERRNRCKGCPACVDAPRFYRKGRKTKAEMRRRFLRWKVVGSPHKKTGRRFKGHMSNDTAAAALLSGDVVIESVCPRVLRQGRG